MRVKSITLTLVLMFAMSACAGTPAATPTPNDPQVVNVSMTTYGFKFTPAQIKPGEVEFVVKNDATGVLHELWIVKTDLAVDKLPLISSQSKVDEESEAFVKLNSVDDLEPGKTDEMTVTLQAGRYVYFCNQPGHYMAGMRGELMVAP